MVVPADEPTPDATAEVDAGVDEAEALNVSLSDVLDLMGQEIERLKLALETYRLSDHPDKDELVRWHVREIDERQDRLESLKQIYLAQRGADGPTH